MADVVRRTGFDVVVRALILERASVEFDCFDMAICEVQQECDGASVAALHHRRPRQRGGSRRPDTNLPSNSLATCARCHEFIESFRGIAVDNGWLVHQTASPREIPVLRRNQLVLLDDLGGFELVRNVMCDNGKSPDQVLEWGDPAPAETGPGMAAPLREARRDR